MVTKMKNTKNRFRHAVHFRIQHLANRKLRTSVCFRYGGYDTLILRGVGLDCSLEWWLEGEIQRNKRKKKERKKR